MVTPFSQDPIISVIHNSIRRGINVTLENECESSAVILMLSAIDAMAYLAMPENQQDVGPVDFIDESYSALRTSSLSFMSNAHAKA